MASAGIPGGVDALGQPSQLPTKLRRGRARSILEGAIDSALLAVEIYNKPRAAFRSEGYITLMIIAWTKLFHAHFHRTIGDRYYYQNKSGRYERVDGERKAWELKTCIRRYGALDPPVTANLNFFVGLRNKIEHRHIAKREVDTLIFGECQSLLYNFENVLADLFGEEYVINENLVYSLQFSRMRTEEQQRSSKKILARELQEIREYVEKYRSTLPSEVFNSQAYSIKLLQVPRVSNTNRNDLAVEFVRWSELSEEDRSNYEQLVTIIKDTVVKKAVVNVGKLRAGDVVRAVEERTGRKFNHHDHKSFYYAFSVRPLSEEERDPFDTDTRFCHYDELHNDYVYQEEWVEFIVDALSSGDNIREVIRDHFSRREKLAIEEFVSAIRSRTAGAAA